MKAYTFMIPPDLAEGLKSLKERDGMSESEAIRRALRAFLIERKVIQAAPERPKAKRRKAGER